MSRTRLLAGLVIGVALVLVGSGSPVQAAAVPSAAPADSVVFNDPTSATAKYDIQNHIIDLINGAPAGSTMRLSIYLFASAAYKDALVNAYNRGAHVQFVADSAEAPASATTWHQLQDVLGRTRRRRRSRSRAGPGTAASTPVPASTTTSSCCSPVQVGKTRSSYNPRRT
jgi:hypothetical protein